MSSDSDIGNEVEQELEAKPRKSRTAPKRLTTAEKFRLLEDWKKGKVDKYYNVIPDKKREGEFKFIKRRVPLDLPPQDNIERSPEITRDKTTRTRKIYYSFRFIKRR